MVIVNRKWPRVTSWILLWSFLSLSIYLSFCLSVSLYLFSTRRLALIRADEMEYVMSVPFACVVSLSLSELTKPVDYWKSMVLREWRAKWVYNVEKSRNRSKELEKGKGEIGWRRSRGGGKCIKSLGDGKLKKVSRFVGRRDFCERACVCVCVWKYEELYGRVWQKS